MFCIKRVVAITRFVQIGPQIKFKAGIILSSQRKASSYETHERVKKGTLLCCFLAKWHNGTGEFNTKGFG